MNAQFKDAYVRDAKIGDVQPIRRGRTWPPARISRVAISL